MRQRPRLAVTGVGLLTALGNGAENTFQRLHSGERGLRQVRLFDPGALAGRLVGEVSTLPDFANLPETSGWSRTDLMALAAAQEALSGAGLASGAARLGVVVGGSAGGMFEAERVLARVRSHGRVPGETPESTREAQAALLSFPLSMTAQRVANHFAASAGALTVCCACSSGAVALAQAAAWLESGRADYVLAGGADGLCRLTLTGFNALGAVDPNPCRPFDKDRAGLNLGEGAGFLVLETEQHARARQAPIHAWLSGYAVQAEAHHITHPEPSGRTAARLLTRALSHAGLAAEDIDYVNAHGTGTQHNDPMEARALSGALGAELERIWVSSSKAQIGHTLAAAGAIEAVLTVLALRDGALPPNIGLEQADPECPLRLVRQSGQTAKLRAALSSSFGFGGTGCVLAFEHATQGPRAHTAFVPPQIVISGTYSLGPLGERQDEQHSAYAGTNERPSDTIALEPLAALDPARSRRFDRACALTTLAAERALKAANLEAAGTGLVVGAAYGNAQRSVQFLDRVMERGARFASPAEFPHLVPSAAAGNASIYLGLTGPVVSVSDLETSAEVATEFALNCLDQGLAERMLAGAVEAYDPIVAEVFAPLCVAESEVPRREGSCWLVYETRRSLESRGGRALAFVQAWGAASGSGNALTNLPPPKNVERSALICVRGALTGVLAAERAWAEAEQRFVLANAGSHEAAGAFALSAATALIAEQSYEQVLVCALVPGRSYFVLLGSEPGVNDASG